MRVGCGVLLAGYAGLVLACARIQVEGVFQCEKNRCGRADNRQVFRPCRVVAVFDGGEGGGGVPDGAEVTAQSDDGKVLRRVAPDRDWVPWLRLRESSGFVRIKVAPVSVGRPMKPSGMM